MVFLLAESVVDGISGKGSCYRTERAISRGRKEASIALTTSPARIIRAVIGRMHKEPADVDDLTQQVWAEVIDGLKKHRIDPARGSVTGCLVKIAGDKAKKHAARQGHGKGQKRGQEKGT
jgi:hypothetical protein